MHYTENLHLLAVISVLCWITPTSPCPSSPEENMQNTNKSKFAQFSTADFLRTRQGTDSGQSTWGWLRLTRRERCFPQSDRDRSKCWDLMHRPDWLQFLSLPCRHQSKLGRAGCLSFGRCICAVTPLDEVRYGGSEDPSRLGELVHESCWDNKCEPTSHCWVLEGIYPRQWLTRGILGKELDSPGVNFSSQQPGKAKGLLQSTDLLVEPSFFQGCAVSLTRF